MKLFEHIHQATFTNRPNRFIIECGIDGRSVRAYLPNPGRLWELLLPGSTLYLAKHASSSGKRTEYMVVAVEKDGMPIMLHTHHTNTVARRLIEDGEMPGLNNAKIIKPEVTIGNSRFDFLLETGGQEMALEIKSCTLFGRTMAMFPDAVTARGRRHILELAELARSGMKTGVIFIVHSPRIEYFMPEHHTDLAFSHALLSVRNDIMVKAVSVEWTKDLSLGSRVKELTIPWELIEKESHDRGSYIVILHLKRERTIRIGEIGDLRFKKGYYLSVGSAAKDLTQRLERHRRLTKKVHGDVDHLRQHAEWVAGLPIRTADDIDCEIAAAVATIADWPVPGFGSSDCPCATHLFGMNENPVHHRKFIELLLDFRINRLERSASHARDSLSTP